LIWQDEDKNELDAMFAIARMAPEEMWRTRMGLDELRNKMNTRVTGELAGLSALGTDCSRLPVAALAAQSVCLQTSGVCMVDLVAHCLHACLLPVCAGLLLGWLKEKGLAPDTKVEGQGARRHLSSSSSSSGASSRGAGRRQLLSPLWLLELAGQQAAKEVGLVLGQ
jgi:hypothetical protein